MPTKTRTKSNRSRANLLKYIDNLPKLQFTSGDITTYIADRPTYAAAWAALKTEGLVKRITVPRGTATTWTRRSTRESK